MRPPVAVVGRCADRAEAHALRHVHACVHARERLAIEVPVERVERHTRLLVPQDDDGAVVVSCGRVLEPVHDAVERSMHRRARRCGEVDAEVHRARRRQRAGPLKLRRGVEGACLVVSANAHSVTGRARRARDGARQAFAHRGGRLARRIARHEHAAGAEIDGNGRSRRAKVAAEHVRELGLVRAQPVNDRRRMGHRHEPARVAQDVVREPRMRGHERRNRRAQRGLADGEVRIVRARRGLQRGVMEAQGEPQEHEREQRRQFVLVEREGLVVAAHHRRNGRERRRRAPAARRLPRRPRRARAQTRPCRRSR